MDLKLRYYKNKMVELLLGEFLSSLLIIAMALLGAYIGTILSGEVYDFFDSGGILGFVVGLFVGSFAVSEIFNKIFCRNVSVNEKEKDSFVLTIGEEVFEFKKSEIVKVKFLPARKLFSRFHKIRIYIGDRCFRFVCTRTIDLNVAKEFVDLLERYKEKSSKD